MSKKCILIVSFLLILASQSVVFGGGSERDPNMWWLSSDTWSGAGTDNLWSNANNWGTGGPNAVKPPDANVWAVITPLGNHNGPNIMADGTCSRLSVWAWSWSNADLWNRDDSNMVAGTMDAGVCIDVAGKVVWTGAYGPGRLNVYGGTMITPAAQNTWTGTEGDINGLWVGGGFTRAGALNVGLLEMSGGLISVPRVALYNGTINLRGGTIEELHPPANYTLASPEQNDFFIYDALPNHTINLAGGKLHLAGDWTNDIRDYNSRGYFIAYDGRGEASWSFDGTWTNVTGIANYGPAWNPNPTNGQVEVNFNPTLMWTPGSYDANKHQVYFGTDADKIFLADTNDLNVYKGTVTDANSYHITGPLAFNTTYYWKIREVNDANTDSPWRGQVWSFTTFRGIAGNPYPPADSNSGFDVNRLYLGWDKGLLGIETDGNGHDVYFGTDWDEVNTAVNTTPIIFRGRQLTRKYYLTDLAANYTLIPDVNYYWRIDEFNSTNPGIKYWKGAVWRFVFPKTYIIDNFDYDTNTAFLTIWKTSTIRPGKPGVCTGYSGTGATIDIDTLTGHNMSFDYNNMSTVAQGLSHFSEVRMESNMTGIDWTCSTVPAEDDAKILYVSYLGQTSNSADPVYDRMYVMAVDNAGHVGPVVYNPDTIATKQTNWQDWAITFSDLKGATALDLTKEVNLMIGFGVRCNGPTDPNGGTGHMLFDSIRVSEPTCNPLITKSADFSHDCLVSMPDLDLFVNDWMLHSEVNNFPSANEPCVLPVLWYKFDEVAGRIAANSGSGGNTYDANIEFNNVNTWNATGRIGGCLKLSFGANSYVNVPMGIWAPYASGTRTAFTITTWMSWDANHAMTNWDGFTDVYLNAIDANVELIELECPIPAPPVGSGPDARIHTPDIDISPSYTQKVGDFGVRWNHYAFVVDADNDVAKIYENGSLIATKAGAINSPMFVGNPQLFHIGSRYGDNWGLWYGKIDDYRLYDRALDADQIAWIATGGTKSITVTLVEPTNLMTGEATEIINFRDYSVLASQWMQEQLWP